MKGCVIWVYVIEKLLLCSSRDFSLDCSLQISTIECEIVLQVEVDGHDFYKEPTTRPSSILSSFLDPVNHIVVLKTPL